MTEQRQHTWRSALLSWALAQMGKPFVWGETDCASLMREALHEMYGQDVAPQLPTWRSAREALTILNQVGDVGELLLRMGATEVPLAFMRAGDVVIAEEPAGPTGRTMYAVCVDQTRCITSSDGGVAWITPTPPCRVFSLWEVALDG